MPYCDFFCHFCPLYKTLDRKQYEATAQQRFVTGLIREIQAYARQLAPQRRLGAVYFGGGTPTSLPQPLFRQIADAVRQEFDLAPDVEFTAEGIPTHFADAEIMTALVAAGVNRISMGAQTFHPEMRKRLGRRDTAEECFRAVKVAHAAGVGSVNIDIMYGYPGQTVEMFAQDLQAVEELAPDSCDFYYYMQIMNTPYREMIAKARYAAADGEVPLQAMRELLLKKFAAWNMLTMETFARLACTAPRIWSVTCGGSSGVAELIAVGPSCYGQVCGYYYYNQPDLSSWLQHIESGLLPVRSKIVLHGKVLAIRRLFGSVLMGRLDEATYAALPRGLRRRVGHWL